MTESFAFAQQTLPRYVVAGETPGTWRDAVQLVAQLRPLVDPIRALREMGIDTLDAADILRLYTIANPVFHAFARDFVSVLERATAFQAATGLDEEYMTTLIHILEHPQEERERLAAELQEFRTAYERVVAIEQRFQELAPTPFGAPTLSHWKKSFRVVDVLPHVDLLLDQCTVSADVPLIVGPRFYKILKGHAYEPDEAANAERAQRGNRLDLYTRWNAGRISLEVVAEEDAEPWVKLSYGLSNPKEQDEPLLRSVCALLGCPRDALEPIEETYAFKVIYPEQLVQWYIWYDLVVVHKVLSQIVSLDEARWSKSRIPAVYMVLPQTQKRLKIRLREENEGVEAQLVNWTVPTGTPLEEVEVAVRAVFERLGKALTLYREEAPLVVRAYNHLLLREGGDALRVVRWSPPETAKQASTQHLKKLQKRNPGLFVAGYTRSCLYPPEMWTEAEGEAMQARERATGRAPKPYMLFPKPEDATALQVPRAAYTCELYTPQIFPGLRENTRLSNRDVYPLIPCCYPNDQRTKRRSKYHLYFNSSKRLEDFRSSDDSDTESTHIRELHPSKYTPAGRSAPCPVTLDDWARLYGARATRRGVARGPHSLLACVAAALERAEPFTVEEVRASSAHPAACCAQELWDTVERDLPDDTTYLDPRVWGRLVEEVAGCRLVLCAPTAKREEVDWVHPKQIHGYLRWAAPAERPVVVVYELPANRRHPFPQCEWIAFAPPFQSDALYQDYLSAAQTIATAGQPRCDAYTSAAFRTAITGTIQEQWVDAYGKIFGFRIDDVDWLLADTRLPPLPDVPCVYDPRRVHPIRQQRGRVGPFPAYRAVREPEESTRFAYERTRQQTALLLANAKHALANADVWDAPERWTEFIVVDPARVEQYDRVWFSSSPRVYVPSEEVQRRVLYTLRVFARRHRMEAEQYRTARFVQWTYAAVTDFAEQPNAIVLEHSSQPVLWSLPLSELHPLDGTIYAHPFLTVVQNVVYRCTPVQTLPAATTTEGLRVLDPQHHRVLDVPPVLASRVYLVLCPPGRTADARLYQCTATGNV